MGIGSVTSMNMNSMLGMQKPMAGSADSKSKSIQNEITDVQKQMQELSSKEELSVDEKTTERKKLRNEMSSLNTELKQHQEELRKSQRREIMMAELRADETKGEAGAKEATETESSSVDADTGLSPQEVHGGASADASVRQAGHQGTVIASSSDGIVVLKEEMKQDEGRGVDTETKRAEKASFVNGDEKNLPADKQQVDETKEETLAEEDAKSIDSNPDTDTGLSREEIHAIASSASSVQQAGRQGTVIAKIRGGIAILKGEMKQDEKRGIDTERKQAELEKMEKKEQRAREFQFSVLGEANNTMKSAAKAKVSGTEDKVQAKAENNALVNALKFAKESRESQQKFYVSFGN